MKHIEGRKKPSNTQKASEMNGYQVTLKNYIKKEKEKSVILILTKSKLVQQKQKKIMNCQQSYTHLLYLMPAWQNS